MQLMKGLIAIIVLVGLSVAAQAIPGFAGRHMDMDPAKLLDRMGDHLELTAGQRERISAVLDNRDPSYQQRREALKAAHRQLRSAMEADNFDEHVVRDMANKMTDMQAEAVVEGATLRAQVREILTPAQREKMGKIIGKKMERRHHMAKKGQRKHRGHRGGREAPAETSS